MGIGPYGMAHRQPLRFLNLNGQRCGDLVAQLAGNGVGAHILDGLAEHDLPLIQLDAGLLFQRFGDFRVGNGAEQPSVAAALGGDGDGQLPQLLGNSQSLCLFLGSMKFRA